MFAALNSDSPAGYYALAALYAAPWLKDGLRLDGFTLFTLLACAAHVQARRQTPLELTAVYTAGAANCYAASSCINQPIFAYPYRMLS